MALQIMVICHQFCRVRMHLTALLSSDEKRIFLGVFLAVLGVQSSLVQCNESAHIVS